MKKNIIKVTKKIVHETQKYIKNNPLIVYFLLFNLSASMIVRFFTIRGFFDISPILADVAILLFIATLSFFVKPKNRFTYLFSMTIFLTLINFINIVYYGYYTSFVSIQMIQLMNNLVDVGDSLTFNVFAIHQFIVLLIPVGYYLFYKNKIKGKHPIVFHKKLYLKETLIAGVVILFLFLGTLEGRDYSRLSKQWNREYIVKKFGIYIYQINDLVKSIEPKISSMFGYDKALKVYKDYYTIKTNNNTKNKYTNIFKGKNVLFIHGESLQASLMNLKINNQEIVPTLNKLAKEGMYFDNFYAQTSVGTSSDAEFVINTSLMPVSNGTVFISYSDRKYEAMPNLFKQMGYSTFSMHANNGTFWNRKVMHENLGYEKFYDKESYEIDDMLGLGLSDESFFKQSVNIIKTIKQPYYGTLIMLSNHTPFIETAKRSNLDLTMKYNDNGQSKIAPYMSTTRLGEYFKSSHYADKTIGDFINLMDQNGQLDNTVVVIYGDHDAKLPKKDYIRMLNYDPLNDETLDKDNPNYIPYEDYQYELNRQVPFIIWSKDKKLKKKIHTATGMIDVAAIIGNMFGFKNPYGMGNDTTTLKDNLVAFPNGNWISNKGYYQKSYGDKVSDGLIPLSKTKINDDYISYNIAHTEQLIDVSNALIVYDLEAKSPLGGK